jgi:hypothetical protein
MSYEYLAHETGYLEKAATSPDQTTNDTDLHRLRLGTVQKLFYGSEGGGLISAHSPKILGALMGSGYAFYTKKGAIWPYAIIGGLLGWVFQLKANTFNV